MIVDTTRRAVFLSYRRDDTRHIAGRLADRLIDRLGATQVFMDVDTIEPGADFAAAVGQEVASCDVLIVLIGRAWLTITDQQGRRRLDDPNDLLALEIRAALEREINVIPVLVDGAVMPNRYDLPESLQGLALRHAVRLDHETFRSDAAVLLDAVERTPKVAYRQGLLLKEKDVAGARTALRQAIDSRHPEWAPLAAVGLGFLLDEQLDEQRDVAGARAAFQRAIDSAHPECAPEAAVNLGFLLKEKDVAGARAAFQQAIDSGHAKWAPKAAADLSELRAHQGWWRPSKHR
ncbi:MAG: TIR domain-containing protein [Pseudonocardiaceae bacterium]